jgi:4-carboxymuconolactone decarboxylase
MSVLEMDAAKFPAQAKALYDRLAAKRRARGEGFGGPYLALCNHPALAERVEALGFYLKFEGVLPRVHYQFIVLSVAHATGAAFEWQDHVQHALAAGLPQSLIDGIAGGANASLPHPFDLLRDILTNTLAWQAIPDALQVQAVDAWGKDGLVEIVVVSGFYQMFAAINQGFDIRSPAQPAPLLKA